MLGKGTSGSNISHQAQSGSNPTVWAGMSLSEITATASWDRTEVSSQVEFLLPLSDHFYEHDLADPPFAIAIHWEYYSMMRSHSALGRATLLTSIQSVQIWQY